MENINVGATANNNQGDSLRDAFIKVNTNFNELNDLLDNKSNVGHTHNINAITGLETQLNSITTDISGLQDYTSSNNQNITDIDDSISDLTSRIEAIEASFTSINNSISSINNAIIDINNKITDLQNN